MQFHRLWLHSPIGWLVVLVATILAAPVAAQTANFETLSLTPGFQPEQGVLRGYTRGSFSLSSISNRDRNGKLCIGFGDTNPDHIVILERDFARLNFFVKSGGDTTLLIQGPDQTTIRCGDDTGSSKDASVSDRNWKKGTYYIWVGTFNPGVKLDYTLTAQQ
jgi:hypothetical protein